MIDLITKHASKQFSTTPCSPCASSIFSKPNNNSVMSDDNISITESISSIDISYLRGRSASFSSTLDLTHRSQRLDRKRASSMEIHFLGNTNQSMHMNQNRDQGLVRGIALSESFQNTSSFQKKADEGMHQEHVNERIPPLGFTSRSCHMHRDSGTISFPGSTASSEGFESLTTSSISDLTVDSATITQKQPKKISKKIRRAASKALRFISNKS